MDFAFAVCYAASVCVTQLRGSLVLSSGFGFGSQRRVGVVRKSEIDLAAGFSKCSSVVRSGTFLFEN